MMANIESGQSFSSFSGKSLRWHIDSAATAHMTFDRSVFVKYKSLTPFSVRMGDSSTALAVGRGDIHLQIVDNGKRLTYNLCDVLHIPSFVYSLISVRAHAKRGLCVQFYEDCAKTVRGSKVIATGT